MNKDPSYGQQQPVYQQQPIQQAQPSYKQPEGESEWQHGLFDCFEGANNLCILLPLSNALHLC